jgi:hypothetical protein
MRKIIVAITLSLISLVTIAQTQTPINITTVVTATPGANDTISAYSSLNTNFTFLTQNTTNSAFCNTTDTCTATTAQTGSSAYTISNTRWGTYKLNNPNFLPNPPGNASVACNPTLTYGSNQYCLVEFHFHGPSEHWVNNSAADLEIHFVFAKATDFVSGNICSSNSLVVLGWRLVGSGSSTNSYYQSLFSGIPATSANGAISGSITVNPAYLMNLTNLNSAPSYRYSGGLTAPLGSSVLTLSPGGMSASPCIAPGGTPGNPQSQLTAGKYPQIVQWVLYRQPIILTPAQVQVFKNVFPDGNARSIQPNANPYNSNTPTTVYLYNPNNSNN